MKFFKQNPHLLGGVRNLDDDQAFIEYDSAFASPHPPLTHVSVSLSFNLPAIASDANPFLLLSFLCPFHPSLRIVIDSLCVTSRYWAELRITRETTPKGLNTWLTSWLPKCWGFRI
eukprot:700946-Amorphochlora_amoeboformis.AAC.1